MAALSRYPGGSGAPDRHIRDNATGTPAPVARAIPYRPPGETAAGTPRRGFLLVAGGAVLLVALTAGATAFVLSQTAPRQQPAPADDNDETHAPAEPGKKTVALKTNSTTRAKQAASITRAAQERFLKTLGTMSGAHVYQSYLNIGLLADGVESEAYTKAEAEQMLTTVGGLIEMVDRELDKLVEMDLSVDEKADVEVIQYLTVLLRRQASALRAYWTTGEEEQITRYQQAREETWAELSELLGLD